MILLRAAAGDDAATITRGTSQALSGLSFNPSANGIYVFNGSRANALKPANGGSFAVVSVTGSTASITQTDERTTISS